MEQSMATTRSDHCSGLYTRLAVIANTCIGGIVGAAFGAFGGPGWWLLGGPACEAT
jgi:hypothetical protein